MILEKAELVKKERWRLRGRIGSLKEEQDRCCAKIKTSNQKSLQNNLHDLNFDLQCTHIMILSFIV